MTQEILFISDLHLSLEKKEITRRFLAFLSDRAPRAQALYILGDLFDSWVGDDDNTPPNKIIKQRLSELTAAGVRVYLQVGNRDFLMGRRFAQETGIELLGDYQVIDLFGTPTLLTHGDLLCTDDHAYQAFRIKSRSAEWMDNVLSKPLWLRLLAARWYRLRSYWHKRKKAQEIMDVNPGTVQDVMRRFQCMQLIHGHTHRPAIHEIAVDGRDAKRFVLADWTRRSGAVLSWTANGYRQEILS
jgi:UDP-2,3-diacylglucosamine hydrolase